MSEWAVSSSVLIAVVIVLRFVFRGKISRRLQYALWGLVLLRLLLPFSLFGSAFSVMNVVPDSIIGENQVYVLPVSRQPVEETSGVSLDHDRVMDANSFGYAVLSEDGSTVTRYADRMSISQILTLAWLAGSIAVGLWFIGANLVLYKRLRNNREARSIPDCKLPVYVTNHVASPCLFGLIRPAIYLIPKAVASADSTRHVLAHELCHYRHGDHLWSMLRCLCLAVWWWNPLVWAAAILSRTDGELACDEAAVKTIGRENRFSYGHTLVDMIAIRKAPGLMYTATTMVSGKRGIKERLNMIIKSPKAVISAVLAVLLIAAVCVGCTFTGADKGAQEPDFPEVDRVFTSGSADLIQIGCDAAVYYYQQFMGDDIPQYWHITKHEVLSCELLTGQLQAGDAQEFTVWVTSYLETDGGGFLVGQGIPTDPDDMSKGGVCPEVGQQFRIKALGGGQYEIVSVGTGGGDQGLAPVGKMIGAEVSLEGETKKITAKRYERGKFNFDYDSLPALPITGGSATLIIMLDSDEDTVRVGEDYYTYIGASGFVDKETYVLNREADDTFRLPVKMRGSTRDETAIYFVETDQDLYVFKAEFPLEKPGEGNESDTDVDTLEACVSDAILNANAGQYGSNDFAAEAHTVLKTVENSNETTVYAMALYLEFGYTGDGFTETGGSHMPVAITFEKSDTGEYSLKEYWIPRDGSEYAPSIKEKFPADIYANALDTQRYIDAHMQSCYEQAIAHFNADADAQIAGLIETITSSPAEMSDPQAYIDAHQREYRELHYYGRYTLRYCFSLFERGGQTGLKGHIMAMVCREILGDAGAIDVPAATGQAWYDALPQTVKDQYR